MTTKFQTPCDLIGVLVAVTVGFVSVIGARAAINNPTNLSDCVLWLDGDDIDGDGTSEGTGENYTNVTTATWADKSGNNRDAVQDNNVSKFAALTAAGLNGRTTLTFDGVNDFFIVQAGANGEPFDGTKSMTAFMVVEYSSVQTTIPFINDGLGGNNVGCQVQQVGAEQHLRGFTEPGAVDTLSPIGTGAKLFMFLYAATTSVNSNYDIRVDGVRVLSRFTSRDATTAANDVGIGTGASATTSPGTTGAYDGEIAEFFVYDRALSVSEINDVGDYVESKWGVTVETIVLPTDAPSTVSDLRFWFDGDDADADSSAEGTNEFFDGTTWWDKSLYHLDGEQSTASQQAELTTNSLNGKTTLTFGGGSDRYVVDELAIRKDEPHTVFFVIEWSTVQNGTLFINDGPGGNKDGGRLLANGADQDIRIFGNPACCNNDGDLIPSFSAGAHILTLRNAAVDGTPGTYTVDVDGSNAYTIASYTRTTSEGGDIDLLGALNGEAAEVIGYSRALTSNELNTVGVYLQDKWGITGSYSTAGPGAVGTVVTIR